MFNCEKGSRSERNEVTVIKIDAWYNRYIRLKIIAAIIITQRATGLIRKITDAERNSGKR